MHVVKSLWPLFMLNHAFLYLFCKIFHIKLFSFPFFQEHKHTKLLGTTCQIVPNIGDSSLRSFHWESSKKLCIQMKSYFSSQGIIHWMMWPSSGIITRVLAIDHHASRVIIRTRTWVVSSITCVSGSCLLKLSSSQSKTTSDTKQWLV